MISPKNISLIFLLVLDFFNDKVNKVLENAESKMIDLIDNFNEKVEKVSTTHDQYHEIDTTDLSYKFSELNDYIEDYS